MSSHAVQINGSFITEIDGVKYYTDGIEHGNISISANIGYLQLGANYNGVNGQITTNSGFGGGAYVNLSANSNGDIKIGGSIGVYNAGIVKYADGTEGIYIGANLGTKLLNVGISVDGAIPLNSNDQLATNNRIIVYENGQYTKTNFSPSSSGAPYPTTVTITTYDTYGKIINTSITYMPREASGSAAAGLPQCFPSSTKIQLSDGSQKLISDIATSDEVAAFHPSQFAGRGGLTGQKVVRLFENITDVWVQLSNGTTVTPGHHFLDAKGAFRTIEDILATDSQIVLANGTVAAITGEYIHYSAETADMFEQAEGCVAQSVGATALAAAGGSNMPHAGGLALAPVFKKGWKTYNFEVANLASIALPANDNMRFNLARTA